MQSGGATDQITLT